MRRVIKDFKSLTDDHMRLIKDQYPNGFSDRDIVEFKTADGGHFEALEVHGEDVLYLVKVNHQLLERIDEFDEENDDVIDFDEDVDVELDDAELSED